MANWKLGRHAAYEGSSPFSGVPSAVQLTSWGMLGMETRGLGASMVLSRIAAGGNGELDAVPSKKCC